MAHGKACRELWIPRGHVLWFDWCLCCKYINYFRIINTNERAYLLTKRTRKREFSLWPPTIFASQLWFKNLRMAIYMFQNCLAHRMVVVPIQWPTLYGVGHPTTRLHTKRCGCNSVAYLKRTRIFEWCVVRWWYHKENCSKEIEQCAPIFLIILDWIEYIFGDTYMTVA